MICGLYSVTIDGANYRRYGRIWSWLNASHGLKGQRICHKVVGESSNFLSLLVYSYLLQHYQFMPFIAVEVTPPP